MPPTRAVAEQVGIPRKTALLTYARLIAEGHLETLPAKGTFVVRFPVVRLATHRAAGLAKAQARFPDGGHDGAPIEMCIGRPVPSLFPAGRWRTLMRDALDNQGARLGTAHPAGSPVLRTAIADWLATSDGLAHRCGPDAAALPTETRQCLPNCQPVLLGFGTLPERQLASRIGQFATLVQTRATAFSAE